MLENVHLVRDARSAQSHQRVTPQDISDICDLAPRPPVLGEATAMATALWDSLSIHSSHPRVVALTGPGMEGRKVAEEEEARLKLLKTLHYLWRYSDY